MMDSEDRKSESMSEGEEFALDPLILEDLIENYFEYYSQNITASPCSVDTDSVFHSDITHPKNSCYNENNNNKIDFDSREPNKTWCDVANIQESQSLSFTQLSQSQDNYTQLSDIPPIDSLMFLQSNPNDDAPFMNFVTTNPAFYNQSSSDHNINVPSMSFSSDAHVIYNKVQTPLPLHPPEQYVHQNGAFAYHPYYQRPLYSSVGRPHPYLVSQLMVPGYAYPRHHLGAQSQSSVRPKAKKTKSPKKVSAKILKDEKPQIPYIELIARAILSRPDRKMLISQIYNCLMEKYKYFTEDNEHSWRNSIRHNLSLMKCFKKMDRSENGRGFYWGIDEKFISHFEQGNFNVDGCKERKKPEECGYRRRRPVTTQEAPQQQLQLYQEEMISASDSSMVSLPNPHGLLTIAPPYHLCHQVDPVYQEPQADTTMCSFPQYICPPNHIQQMPPYSSGVEPAKEPCPRRST